MKMKASTLLVIFLFLGLNLAFAQEEEPFVYNDKGKRDPFIPLVAADGRYLSEIQLPYFSGNLRLTGILWDAEGKSSCLINNQVVKIGETIGEFTIKDITKDSVIVSKDGKEHTIKVSVEEKE